MLANGFRRGSAAKTRRGRDGWTAGGDARTGASPVASAGVTLSAGGIALTGATVAISLGSAWIFGGLAPADETRTSPICGLSLGEESTTKAAKHCPRCLGATPSRSPGPGRQKFVRRTWPSTKRPRQTEMRAAPSAAGTRRATHPKAKPQEEQLGRPTKNFGSIITEGSYGVPLVTW